MMSAQGYGFPVCVAEERVELSVLRHGRYRGRGVDHKCLIIEVPPRMLDVVQDYTCFRMMTPSSYGLPQSAPSPSKHFSMNTAVSTIPKTKHLSEHIFYDGLAAQGLMKLPAVHPSWTSCLMMFSWLFFIWIFHKFGPCPRYVPFTRESIFEMGPILHLLSTGLSENLQCNAEPTGMTPPRVCLTSKGSVSGC